MACPFQAFCLFLHQSFHHAIFQHLQAKSSPQPRRSPAAQNSHRLARANNLKPLSSHFFVPVPRSHCTSSSPFTGGGLSLPPARSSRMRYEPFLHQARTLLVRGPPFQGLEEPTEVGGPLPRMDPSLTKQRSEQPMDVQSLVSHAM